MDIDEDTRWMKHALSLAQQAATEILSRAAL